MIDLGLLQTRLARIPEMISERRLRDSFAKFTNDLQVSEAQLNSARNDAIHVNYVFPHADCVKQVEQKATLVLNKLSRVQTLVAKDSFKIKSRTVDNSIAEIKSLSGSTNNRPGPILASLEILIPVNLADKDATKLAGPEYPR